MQPTWPVGARRLSPRDGAHEDAPPPSARAGHGIRLTRTWLLGGAGMPEGGVTPCTTQDPSDA
ncbi:MAG TPA: hypothetical protein VGQ52_09025 [Gemmatimonadaceae bacterium]|nr:hypothetical protein [Gemmatimonadaceae bacterium]